MKQMKKNVAEEKRKAAKTTAKSSSAILRKKSFGFLVKYLENRKANIGLEIVVAKGLRDGLTPEFIEQKCTDEGLSNSKELVSSVVNFFREVPDITRRCGLSMIKLHNGDWEAAAKQLVEEIGLGIPLAGLMVFAALTAREEGKAESGAEG